MRRVIARAGGVAAMVVLGAALLILAGTFVPTLFGFSSEIVVSGSMGRTVPVGSVALARTVDVRAVSMGDIVSFRPPDGNGTTVTHRVIAIEDEGAQMVFTTKGDANQAADPEAVVATERIHRVEVVVPYVGHVVRYVRSPLGAVVFLAVPILGLVLDRPLRSREKRRRRRAEVAGWSTTTLAFVGTGASRFENAHGG